MLNNLDIMIIVFSALVIAGVLSIALMVFSKRLWLRRLGFFAVAILGIYVSSVAVRVLSVAFPVQYMLGITMGVLSAAVLLLEICGKGKRRVNMLIGAVALIVGIINAFIV